MAGRAAGASRSVTEAGRPGVRKFGAAACATVTWAVKATGPGCRASRGCTVVWVVLCRQPRAYETDGNQRTDEAR
ncbi:hypothetical protein [Streptomyces sp. NPDC051636]|uniref:hypothetical protein n=1 Tax=Streptomyces sp. NPDC051636 TaxID=3365663 RepID=UPI0037AFDEF2